MTTPTRSPVTQLLAAVSGGDAGAQDRLWSLIYDELRRLAQHQMATEAPGHTLQPTALVHEAYFRLFGENPAQWSNRGYFFTAAAEWISMDRDIIARRQPQVRSRSPTLLD